MSSGLADLELAGLIYMPIMNFSTATILYNSPSDPNVAKKWSSINWSGSLCFGDYMNLVKHPSAEITQ